MNYKNLLAVRTKTMGVNAIREILKVVSRPGMISLAGGIPAPESFPLHVIRELSDIVLTKYGDRALQYDMTEGFIPLRIALSEYLMEAQGVGAGPDEILVTSGSQGVLDAVGKILIGKGDPIAVEAPTYLGAIQAFNSYEPEYVRMDTDDDGLIPDSLNDALAGGDVKFVYLVPTFQNPTGRTIPLQRRIEIAEILKARDALLIEDDPYSLLRYRGFDLPPIQTLAPDHVVYVGTLSKVLAPGLRIGFCVAPESIRRWMVVVKQGVDLHTSTFNQALAAEYLNGGYLKAHLPKILDYYAPKLSAMIDAFRQYLPDGFRYSEPEGGMFLWVVGPAGVDMEEVYRRAIERNIAFVPGKYFFTDPGEGMETARFNFTMADEDAIAQSVRILGEVLETIS